MAKRTAPAIPTRKTTRTTPPTRAARAQRATKATARRIAGYAVAKKATDVRVMDLRRLVDVTSFFVVCTGSSSAQVKAIADHVLENCERAGNGVYQVEGYDALRWVLIDLVDVVVHVFQPEVRAYYQLERLWGDAPCERVDDDATRAAPR